MTYRPVAPAPAPPCGRAPCLRLIALGLILLGLRPAGAVPTRFDIPAQPADQALVQFTTQARVDLLYAPNELHETQSTSVQGTMEPADALVRLLSATGFGARAQGGRFHITRIPQPRSLIEGRITTANGEPNAGTRVIIPDLRRATTTNPHGEYRFDDVPLGDYTLIANRSGFHPLHIEGIRITAPGRTYLAPNVLRAANLTNELEPVIVEGHLNRRGPFDPGPTIWGPRRAGGNLDLNRTVNDVLPFIIYDRDRIARSGVVSLNDFLRRELLDTDTSTLSLDQGGSVDQSNGDYNTGSSNLSLRGFSSEETVILVNGRRLPEVLTAGSGPLPPDVNFIPLSLVQQVQVLPASASALYSGNAVGGVINILLRPDNLVNHTEVTATYTNATEGFDAANSSVSLLNSQVLLDGKLSLRLNANFVDTMPATDTELKFHRDRAGANPGQAWDPVYRATPNLRSVNLSPLLAGSASPHASVAPGADGSGGLAALAPRVGARNYTLYDGPGDLTAAKDSVDYAYGRREKRTLFFASALYDFAPWLEVGLDAAYSSTVINRGYDVFKGDLLLRSDNPLNPFGQDVRVSLLETPSALPQNYNEAHLDFYSLVGSALVTLPWDFKLAIDAQYAHSVTRHRGLAEVDQDRWQALVDRGAYHPLRDTQTIAPPAAFYDEALIFTGGRDRFVTVGDYETFDGAFRLTHDALPLPTGASVFNLGADYRIANLKGFETEFTYGDGSPARERERWQGRTLERVSAFTELQAPLVPRTWLPDWIDAIETDLAARFIVADSAAETNLAPTLGLKFALANGLTLRGSFTTSNRFPTPYMSSRVGNGVDVGTGLTYVTIFDPRRNESYDVDQREVRNLGLSSENAVTQTAGVIFERGERNRIRVALDFFDTRKTNEITGLGPTELMNLEAYFPELVVRAAPLPGDPNPIGRVTQVRTTSLNLARRHSQNWMGTFDYARRDVFGGTFDLRGRLVYFPRYERQIVAGAPTINEIQHPSGSAPGLLEYRATFGGGWSNRNLGFGLDGQYFHSRRLPEAEWAGQGARTIDPFWQTDLYFQADLAHWLLPADSRYGLRGQVRVNNVFKDSYPYYANEKSGAGLQPYGDWRGRTFSLSISAEF